MAFLDINQWLYNYPELSDMWKVATLWPLVACPRVTFWTSVTCALQDEPSMNGTTNVLEKCCRRVILY